MDSLTRLDSNTKAQLAQSYTTRRIPLSEMNWLATGIRPYAGDLVLARVKKIGYHKNLQGTNRVRRRLFPGDLIVVAYANRYVSNQYEAEVPKNLRECHLVAGGGCASFVKSQHARMRAATRIEPLGLVCGDQRGIPLNLGNFAIPPHVMKPRRIPVVGVVGTAMDSGKTTTAAHLIHGASRVGVRMGYAKVTGTGASGDPGVVTDAGAISVLDFTDAGYASTYKVPAAECECILNDLVAESQDRQIDALVVEFADGVYQAETAALLASPALKSCVDGVFMAAGDAMGADSGVAWLKRHGITVFGLAGALEASPLQMREATTATGLPVYTREKLESTELLTAVFAQKDDNQTSVPPLKATTAQGTPDTKQDIQERVSA